MSNRCAVPWKDNVTGVDKCKMFSMQCSTYLLTDVHVGKATPFSIVFPLKTLAAALHWYNTHMSALLICATALAARTLTY